MAELIDTDKFSEAMRRKGIDLDRQRILISRLAGSDQEKDITKPTNCGGYGRIRHFRRQTTPGWPANPLPNDPAHKALGLPTTDVLHAQVFQNAVCNWRCWYCFVPFELLSGDEDKSGWLSARELLDLYLAEPDAERAAMIDLSGGQPDLVPEWVPWMMRDLQERGLEGKVYLWSDDNLSNDYFWQHLTDADRNLVANFKGYGRVACFKGFDPDSFSFNTKAAPELFERQFELFARLLTLGIDLYAYTTFTAMNSDNIDDSMARFVDRLQALDPNLPLRTVPLEVYVAGVVQERAVKHNYLPRANESRVHQQRAIEAWCRHLEDRFSCEQRAQNIADVPLVGTLRP